VSFYDWLLFLHVLSAFSLVAAMVVFWALILATRPASPLLSQEASGAASRPATVAVAIGTVGTLVFGIWLAIDHDDYQLWDGWIIAALVLWAVNAWLGGQAGKAFTAAMDGSPEPRRRGLLFHSASSVAVLLLLIVMIYKPGA
jgi:uncharacterized membrane protein